MAKTTVTPIQLSRDTATADHADANATAISVGADGWQVLDSEGVAGNRMVFKFVTGAAGATITILAGTKPPSMNAGKGNLAITLAANDVKYVAIDQSRFRQADGSIQGLSSANAESMSVFILPRDI